MTNQTWDSSPIVHLHDAFTGSSAAVAVHRGFNCFEFIAMSSGHRIDVLDSERDFATGAGRPSGNGIPILFPFPNRIREGRYDWDGKTYELPSSVVGYDGTGNAIHGFCLDRPWRVVESKENTLLGRFQLSIDAPDRLPLWPTDFVIDVRYSLNGPKLRMDVHVRNEGEIPLPWGFGTHPYFKLPLSHDSAPQHCLIEAPAAQQWVLESCLPTGAIEPIDDDKDLREGAYFDLLKFDDVLTGLEHNDGRVECSIIDEKAGLQVVQRFDAIFRELVVYTPPGRNSICLEPYTCVTDAINLQARGVDTGLRVLGPGREIHTWIEIEAGPVLA